MILQTLTDKKLISPPKWVLHGTQYLAVCGSISYGVAEDSSDYDVKGCAIPPRHEVFPHEAGLILGFDQIPQPVTNWQKHHIMDVDALGGSGREYDFSIFNIVKYFYNLTENNPDAIDSLFVPRECVLYTTELWEAVRSKRKLFLHKGVAQKLKAYAYSQLKKADGARNSKELLDILEFEKANNIPHSITYNNFLLHPPECDIAEYTRLWDAGMAITKRFESRKVNGFDPKYLYHIYRLASQAEYILVHEDLDLQEDGRREKMKAIRRGEVNHEDVYESFKAQEKRLDNLMLSSTLREKPDWKAIKILLMSCLESHYGSIDECFKSDDKYKDAIAEITNTLVSRGLL